MPTKNQLDYFGRELMSSVRDRSIDKFNKTRSGVIKSDDAIEMHKLFKLFDNNQIEIIEKFIMESIDNTIYNFLFMIEENYKEIQLNVCGENINEASDGLSGELFTSDGWMEKFSEYKP